MSSEIEEFRNEINVSSIADAGAFQIEIFAEVVGRRLEDLGAVSNLYIKSLRCNGPRSRRLEMLGYAEDPIDQSLTILAGQYFGRDDTLTMSVAKNVMGRATGFVEAAVQGWLTSNLEISSREWEYADYFGKKIREGGVARIRLILITDGVMSERIRTIESDSIVGLRVSYEIWDQRRIIDAGVPERGSEDIVVDFRKWIPDGLSCLVAPGTDASTRTYLAVVPANVLADVFDEYGSLLLESNVRTFLSARGQVNRGIQGTLAHEPDRFLAYNNGLTTTATEVELGRSPQGVTILRLHRWQIVNGGQTTASLAHYLRTNKSRNVDSVSIQMKLVTVSEVDSATVVQAVAKYANSQNKVSAADLFSTHEFHVRLEQISRRLRAPAQEGRQYQTGWFYERARGQWENDKSARGSRVERAKFDLEFPKSQRITKTDWAKYDYCWNQHPDLVSRGAQSVFADFARAVDAQWTANEGKGSNLYGDAYFRTGVGRAIMYNTIRREILKQEWYKSSPGYLANIVAYSIARFSVQIDSQFGSANYDFEGVWLRQAIGTASVNSLLKIARRAQAYLTDSGRPQANVTQWAKQQACWEGFKRIEFRFDESLKVDLISSEENRARAVESRKERVMDSGFEDIQRVLAVPLATWDFLLSDSLRAPISPKEHDLIELFGTGRGRVPSDRQAAVLIRLLDRLAGNGVIGRDAY